LAEKFPRHSEAKIKEGFLVGSQICELFRENMFNNLLQGDKKITWDAFHWVLTNLLWNIMAENCNKWIEDMLSLYHKID
jgi:hypothetical protein